MPTVNLTLVLCLAILAAAFCICYAIMVLANTNAMMRGHVRDSLKALLAMAERAQTSSLAASMDMTDRVEAAKTKEPKGPPMRPAT